MIPPEVIDDIRNRSDIVSVISEYVALKKRGRNYLGLCPFHSEKTASFTVSAEKQMFHCFGCGEGGNIFSFLMKIENIGFAEAVAELGEKLGIKVSKPLGGSGLSTSEKEKIYSTMLLAAKFFRAAFEAESGKPARDYLAGRGVGEAAAKTFALGFAPAAWDSLFKHLIARGAAPELIEKAGLTLPRENKDGYYDRFRNRLMFPVCDSRGRVVAFSGRALDNSEPKYLNSPDTPVYRKGDTVFGLNLAKEAVKKEKFAVLVEGNLDTVTVHQSGVLNVAAPLGTALTAAQCKLLARSADTIVLAFDADPAGEAAAERSAEIIRAQGMKVKVASFAGAKDPDELIRKNGAESFKTAIEQALPYLEFKLRRLISRYNLNDIEARGQALKEAAKLLGAEKDGFTQKEYAKLAAGLLKVDGEALQAEIKRQGYYGGAAEKNLRRVTEKPGSRRAAAEQKLIALAVDSGEGLRALKEELTEADFRTPQAAAVAKVLFGGEFAGEGNFSQSVLDKITDEAVRNYLTGAVLSEHLEKPGEIMRDCIAVIRSESSKSRIDGLKEELRAAEQANDAAKAAEIISAIKNEIY